MECKCPLPVCNTATALWINRYIMECKWALKMADKTIESELIDTLWNVNLKKEIGKLKEDLELIDTLWNVNDNQRYWHDGQQIELIDTLWNVNIKIDVWLAETASGINRYIMECKFLWVSGWDSRKSELIDTLWNVNI